MRFIRYFRYRLAFGVLPRANTTLLFRLCSEDLDDRDLVTELQKIDSTIDKKELQKYARTQFGYFRKFWQKDFIESLRLDRVTLAHLNILRGRLSPDEQDKLEDAIGNTLIFLEANDYSKIIEPDIVNLQKMG